MTIDTQYLLANFIIPLAWLVITMVITHSIYSALSKFALRKYPDGVLPRYINHLPNFTYAFLVVSLFGVPYIFWLMVWQVKFISW